MGKLKLPTYGKSIRVRGDRHLRDIEEQVYTEREMMDRQVTQFMKTARQVSGVGASRLPYGTTTIGNSVGRIAAANAKNPEDAAKITKALKAAHTTPEVAEPYATEATDILLKLDKMHTAIIQPLLGNPLYRTDAISTIAQKIEDYTIENPTMNLSDITAEELIQEVFGGEQNIMTMMLTEMPAIEPASEEVLKKHHEFYEAISRRSRVTK